MKVYATGCEVPFKVTPGHSATNHAHTSYYIDMTALRTRLSEAQEIAKSLMGIFLCDTVMDITVCLEGTQVIGSFLTQELTRVGALSTNVHRTIYIVVPEYNSNSQMVFKENVLPMIRGKDVILLTASVIIGLALDKGIGPVLYYGGVLRGITAIFSALDETNGHKIISISNKRDVPEYAPYDYRDRLFCKQDKELEVLVNSHGYTSLQG